MPTIRNKATLDSRPFSSGIDKMESRVAGFSKSVQSFGKIAGVSFGAAAVVGFAKSTLKTADEIDNLAKQTDLGIESVQALKLAAEETGVEFRTLRPAINQFRRALEQAKTGSSQQIRAFEQLGISAKQFAGMSTQQALEAVAKKMSEGAGDAETMKAATTLLGAESTRLRTIFQDLGSVGIEGLIGKYKDLGMIMEEDVVRSADRMEEQISRSFDRLKKGSMSLTTQIAGGFEYYFRRLKGESAADIGADMFGYETTEATTPEERAQMRRDQERAAAAAKKELEDQISALNEKRRFENLSKDAQAEELKRKRDLLDFELLMTDSLEERLELTKQIYDVERRLGSEGETKEREKKAYMDYMKKQREESMDFEVRVARAQSEALQIAQRLKEMRADDYKGRLEAQKRLDELQQVFDEQSKRDLDKRYGIEKGFSMGIDTLASHGATRSGIAPMTEAVRIAKGQHELLGNIWGFLRNFNTMDIGGRF